MSGFDPIAYKNQQRQIWKKSAEAWYRWTPTLSEWLRPATDAMLDGAGIAPGQRVLDIAAGAGEPAVSIAERVGAKGRVLATDLSPTMLSMAEARARDRKVTNVETRVMDGERLELSDGEFDAVTSRLGVIYFADRVGALREMHRVCKPGGRVAIAGFSNAEANPLFAIPLRILSEKAKVPPLRAGMPGPFSLGAVMHEALGTAGFNEVEVRTVDATLSLPSAKECTRFMRESFGGLDFIVSTLSASERDAAWNEVATELRSQESNGAFASATQLVVGCATR